ncbi:MAG: hypothetical protein A2Y50_08455 [Pseudomonadales bacterium RIFCSPLOWO2_12_59_9]|uniref:hypothetical protein n=1 Tax=Pseudomonas sp. TaxID=306 RepID=UPI0008C89ECA|nr:MAG: hypothetical protein A2Y50_08455 [Pseudomonadales bacterium RIFCSPLOWO2_12_59_9]
MLAKLTRLIRPLSLLFFTGVLGSVSAAEIDSGLSSPEQVSYLAGIQRAHPHVSERQALLAQCNQLLKTYALRAGYQLGQADPRDLLYQLSISGPGELLLREESRAPQGPAVAVRNQQLSVFGVDPFIRYDCPLNGIRCVLQNPADGSPLLSVLRDQDGAAELAKALSFLIRNLQKG